MADVFTRVEFYKDCPDYLYLFQHMATKTMCEAVVEGMGSVWDQCTDPHRHPRFEMGAKEACRRLDGACSLQSRGRPFR